MTQRDTHQAIRNDRSTYIWALLLLLVVGLPTLLFPFGRDQGIHAYVADSWLQGELPFRDTWTQKGPLAFSPHLLTTTLFGHSMWGIRLFDLVWQVACGWLVFHLALSHMGRVWAAVVAGLYFLVYYAFGYWNIGHTESFFSLFVLLGLSLYGVSRHHRRHAVLLFLSGICLGVTPWFKQTAVVHVAALVLWAMIDQTAGRNQGSIDRSGDSWRRHHVAHSYRHSHLVRIRYAVTNA